MQCTLTWGDRTHCWAEADGTEHVVLALDLDRRGRRSALAHELIHLERQIFYDSSTPAGLVQVEERAVDHEVARRLVPPVELDDWLAARGREPTTVADVVEEWDVAPWVAERALRQAAQRRQAPGHPVFRR